MSTSSNATTRRAETGTNVTLSPDQVSRGDFNNLYFDPANSRIVMSNKPPTLSATTQRYEWPADPITREANCPSCVQGVDARLGFAKQICQGTQEALDDVSQHPRDQGAEDSWILHSQAYLAFDKVLNQACTDVIKEHRGRPSSCGTSSAIGRAAARVARAAAGAR